MTRAILVLVLTCTVLVSNAQFCPHAGQSPKNAIPVCGTAKFSAPFAQPCAGPFFPNTGGTCQQYREDAAHWYKFTATQGGTLQLTITPHDLLDDYDWIIFDITGLDENDVYTNPNITIVSNWSATKGVTGTNATALNLFECMQPIGNSAFSRMPQLITGHTYLAMVNTIYSTNNGYDIDLRGGTAVIYDPLDPALVSASYDHAQTIVSVKLNKPMNCQTTVYDGTEFVINPGNIQAGFSDPEGCISKMHTDSILLYLSAPLAPGNYTVTIQNGSDGHTILDFCERAIPVGESVPLIIGTPMILNAQVDKSSCNGADNGSAMVSVNGGVLPFSYHWNSTPAQTSSTATGLAPGNYTVTVKDATGNEQTAQVTIPELAAIQLTETHTDITCRGVANGAATIIATGGVAPYTYYWPQNERQTTATITNMSPGTYSCVVTDANNCSEEILVTILLDNPPPLAEAGTDLYLCDGNPVTLAGNTTGSGTGQWTQVIGPSTLSFSNPASPTTSVNNIQPGVYMLRWSIARGNCASTDDVVITRHAEGVADAGADTTIVNQEIYRMRAAIPSYGLWTQLRGPSQAFFDDLHDPQTNIRALQEGVYTFRWTLDMTPCAPVFDEITLTVKRKCIFRMPNAFSPNGDQQNDTFKPARICGVVKYEMVIFNRWGEKIFVSKDPLLGWDGNINSRKQPVEMYVWMVTYINVEQKQYQHHGTVYLTR